MNRSFLIKDIKKRHYELYSESFADRSDLLNNQVKRDKFAKRVSTLLENMRDVAAEITSTADYVWLSSAFEQWQLAFSSLKISNDIQLPKPAQRLKPSLSPVSINLRSDDKVKQWIKDKAYYISKDRKEQLLKNLQDHPERLREIVWQPSRILEILGSGPEHIENQKDWYNANIHFAGNVLDGAINFARQIGPKSYCLLEKQWLEEVKQLKAYFIWENRGDGFNIDRAVKDYCEACEEIEGKSFNKDVSRNDFKEVADYLKTRYLESNGTEIYRLDTTNCKSLIDKKANHLYQMTREQNPKINWLHAENYVRTFYENIIPAVLEENNEENVLAVREVIQPDKASVNHLLINCFEMALVIYFLPPSG